MLVVWNMGIIWDMLVVWYMGMWENHRMWYGMCWRHGTGKTQYPGIWYGMFAVWYHGTMSWMYCMAKFAWWYGMLQLKITSRRVEYVVRISSVKTSLLYISHWLEGARKDKPCGQTGRQICIYQNKDSVLQSENKNWHRREVDLVHGFPFVSEVFFFQESDEWSMLKIMLHLVGCQGKY